MILVIDAMSRSRLGAVLDEMFELRARVFADRLGWDVEVRNGREEDAFDGLDPAYVVGLDGEGRVVSCARLLPTTGPHMLADALGAILDGEPPLRSPHLWEATRVCVDTERLHRDAGGGSGEGSGPGSGKASGGGSGQGSGERAVSRATAELVAGILEFARRSGVSDIVAVIDPVMDGLLRRSGGAPCDSLGRAVPMGAGLVMAALLDCTPERIARARAVAGIEGEAPAGEEALLLGRAGRIAPGTGSTPAAPARPAARTRRAAPAALAAPAAPAPVPASDIYSYCVDQIRSARTEGEREAAFALVRELLRSRGLPGEGPEAHSDLSPDLSPEPHPGARGPLH